jgi:Tol biopolymer transport system component
MSTASFLSQSVVLPWLAATAFGACGGGGDPVSPPDSVPADTIPLDGRGGGVLSYTLQPGPGAGVYEIHVMNADGTGDRQIIHAAVGLNHHDWSPDGQRFAAVGYYADATSVNTFDVDGQNLTRLTHPNTASDTEPTWSPDGSEIAFTRFSTDQDGRGELWLMNADGSDQRWIGVEGFIARWSPDGTRLIFQSRHPQLAGGQFDIMTCAVDGSDVRAVTETADNELTPIWSPDGSQIAFIADYDGDFELYVMASDGTSVRQLTENEVNDYSPRWSPDGSMIAFDSDSSGSEKWEIYIINADGTNLRRVTHTSAPNTAINAVWRPSP